jgi:hypothetical protein
MEDQVDHWRSLSLTALLFVATSGLQPAVAAEIPATQMNIDELTARLNLTPEQQAQIAPLAETRRSKLEGIRGKLDSASSRRDKRAVLQEAKAVQDEFTSKVEPLLTAEQKSEWQKMREETRSKMKERFKNR